MIICRGLPWRGWGGGAGLLFLRENKNNNYYFEEQNNDYYVCEKIEIIMIMLRGKIMIIICVIK
jgi:hypothetical protein